MIDVEKKARELVTTAENVLDAVLSEDWNDALDNLDDLEDKAAIAAYIIEKYTA